MAISGSPIAAPGPDCGMSKPMRRIPSEVCGATEVARSGTLSGAGTDDDPLHAATRSTMPVNVTAVRERGANKAILRTLRLSQG